MHFKDRNLVLTILEVEKTKIKMLTDSVSGKDPFLVSRQLSSYCVLT